MSKKKKQVEEFFNEYELHFNEGLANDPNANEKIATSFASCFVESSPAGVICGKNDAQFTEKTGQGLSFYKNIGTQGMNIISKDITLLDDYHALAKIYWRYTYQKDNTPGTIDFNTFYLVNIFDGEVKIFAYMTGDELKVLKEKGLLMEEKAETA